MSNNLNKMSIKDYFKHLYDQVVANIKLGNYELLFVNHLILPWMQALVSTLSKL